MWSYFHVEGTRTLHSPTVNSGYEESVTFPKGYILRVSQFRILNFQNPTFMSFRAGIVDIDHSCI